MFALCLSPTFEAPVRLEIQAPTGGKRQVVEFTAVFQRLDGPTLATLAAQADAAEISDTAVADRLLVGWGADVTTAAGDPLPYTPEAKARVLAVAGMPAAIVRSFRAALPGAPAGN